MANTPISNYVTVKKQALRDLQSLIASAGVSDDVTFQQILSACRSVLEMSEQQVADALLVSRPTVNRWVNGNSVPHPAMRRPIFDWVDSQVSRRLRMLDAKVFFRTELGTTSEPYPMAVKKTT